MKKELLLATALVTSMGMVASSAQAATATFSGKTRVGVKGADTDGTAAATYAAHEQSTFSVSISETTDSGIKISTGFDLTDENDGATDPSGLTLTFTDGSVLDLIEAGNAAASKLATVPGASGEQSISASTQNSAPSGLTYGNASDKVGFEWHSAADFGGVSGLKVGLSASINDDAAATVTTSATENAYSLGISYVSTAGDTTVTVGGGFVQASSTSTRASKEQSSSSMIALSAVTGDLTVGVGYAGGDYVRANSESGTTAGADASDVDDVSVLTAGAKYVSGDITFAVGIVDGEGTDTTVGAANAGSADTYNKTAASIDYVIAPGVTGTIGWSEHDSEDEGAAAAANSGNSWYIGANVSF
jgi:hypothetical protein